MYTGRTYRVNSQPTGYNYSVSDCASFCQNSDDCKGYALISETAQGLADIERENKKCILLTHSR